MTMDRYCHYIKVDDNNRVVGLFSTAFARQAGEDICIKQDGGRHAQLLGEVNPNLCTFDGIPLYCWDGEHVIPRTEAEIEADRKALPPVPPTELEKLSSKLDAAIQSNAMLEDCLVEMAGVVYA